MTRNKESLKARYEKHKDNIKIVVADVNIAAHFKGLYPIIIDGSLVFHLIYGALTGFVSGRMAEIGTFIGVKQIMR